MVTRADSILSRIHTEFFQITLWFWKTISVKLGSKGDKSLKMSGDGNDMWGEDEDDALLAMVDDVEQVLHLF